ncbi:hypothetical protein THITH_05365 [Thioalkalivibrio paradoxus ARh 1]|uniref:Uncharacterized protein n=1 Tax=Thioalkalivibrio paradoxus ARh 1 TaxID=713585 RepID=W0DN05_9GAMM|nr:hypothetical protein THITH_05365 [Thioalkalivibrio paradoxus ARh 1]
MARNPVETRFQWLQHALRDFDPLGGWPVRRAAAIFANQPDNP